MSRRRRGRQHYKKGAWKAQSDYSGFVHPSNEMKKTWDGYWVHFTEWEPRQPQDELKVPRENPSIPWSRPRNETDV